MSCLDLSDTLNVATTSKNTYANTSRVFLNYRCSMYGWFGNFEGIRESVKDFFRSNIAPFASDAI